MWSSSRYIRQLLAHNSSTSRAYLKREHTVDDFKEDEELKADDDTAETEISNENLSDPIAYDDEDLIPKRVLVRLGKREFVLIEAGAEAARLYRNALVKGVKIGANGKATEAGSIADTELVLVQNCLFEVITQPNGAKREGPVNSTWLRQLPDRIINRLYLRAKAISPTLRDKKELKKAALKAFDEESAKNSQNAIAAN
jgi:hypothetical protein